MDRIPMTAEAVIELRGALSVAAPYARDAALRYERLGLGEEAAAAWAIYHRVRRALRVAGAEGDWADRVEHED